MAHSMNQESRLFQEGRPVRQYYPTCRTNRENNTYRTRIMALEDVIILQLDCNLIYQCIRTVLSRRNTGRAYSSSKGSAA